LFCFYFGHVGFGCLEELGKKSKRRDIRRIGRKKKKRKGVQWRKE